MTVDGDRVSRPAGPGARVLVFAIRVYRNMISPLRLPSCRFVPTCSEYALDALTQFGLLRGSWLAMIRLTKCGPWHRGGWDPVPECSSTGSSSDAASDGRNETHV